MITRRRGRAHIIQGPHAEFDLLGDLALPPHDAARLAANALHRLGLDAGRFEKGDYVVGERGFGAATTMDWFALGLSLAGVGGLLAPSIDTRFREACILAGVPILTLSDVHEAISDQDDLIIDFRTGTVENVTRHRISVAAALAPLELARVREAPSLQWYGLAPPTVDPDVLETGRPNAPVPAAGRVPR